MGRPKKDWSPQEDDLLRAAVNEALTHSRPLLWRDLAKFVPGRTNKACRRRWWNSLADNIAKGPWSETEDERLVYAVGKHGTRWSQVSRAVGSRNSEQCSSHWSQVLDPDINHCDWTAEEDDQLLHEVLSHQTNWTTIATSHAPKKTTLALKNRYSALRLRHNNKEERRTFNTTSRIGTGAKSSRRSFKSGRDAVDYPKHQANKSGKETENEDENDEVNDDGDEEDDDDDDDEDNDYEDDNDATSSATAASKPSRVRGSPLGNPAPAARSYSKPSTKGQGDWSGFEPSGDLYPTSLFQEGISTPSTGHFVNDTPSQATFMNPSSSNSAPLYSGEPFFNTIRNPGAVNMVMPMGPYGKFGLLIHSLQVIITENITGSDPIDINFPSSPQLPQPLASATGYPDSKKRRTPGVFPRPEVGKRGHDLLDGEVPIVADSSSLQLGGDGSHAIYHPTSTNNGMPLTFSASQSPTPFGKNVETSSKSLDFHIPPTPPKKPSVSNPALHQVVISMVCTAEQLTSLMGGLASAGTCINIKVDPQPN